MGLGKDENHESIATAYFLFLGGGCQIGWSAILNGLDYFSMYYPQKNVNFMFPIAIFTAQFLVTLIMAKLSSIFSYTVRVIIPLTFVGCILAFLPFGAAIFQNTDKGFYILMSLLFVMGFSTNICYSSLIGLASQLKAKYTSRFLIGGGAASMFMSLLRISVTMLFTGKKTLGVSIYFVVASLFLIWCGVLHFLFIRSPFFTEFSINSKCGSLVDEEGRNFLKQKEKTLAKPERSFGTLFAVFKEVRIYVFLIVVTYIQMFAVFPGVMLAKPIPGIPSDVKVVSMNLMFSTFFLLGKKLGEYRNLYNKEIVAVLIIFRFALVAFFVMQVTSPKMAILETIWFGYLNIALFALTNGFVMCALFILAPEEVDESKKEVAGFVSVFGLKSGVIIGTLTALPFKSLGAHAH